MTDFIKDFFQTVNERLRNRVFGPFLISFIFWNWKPLLLILASNKSIEETIDLIVLCSYFNILNVLIIPLAISIVYSLTIPFLSILVTYLVKWPTKISIKSASEIKGTRKEAESKIAHWDHAIEKARAGEMSIADLNDRINKLEESNSEYITQNQNMRESLKSLEKEKLSLLTTNNSIRGTYSNYVFNTLTNRYPEQEQSNFLNALEALSMNDTALNNVKYEIREDLERFGIVESLREGSDYKRIYILTDFGKMFISHILNN